MSSKNAFLPGLYRNFPLEKDESLPGYLLRLAAGNGYAGVVDLLRAVVGLRAQKVDAMVRDLRASRDSLEVLGRAAVGQPDHLMHFLGSRLEDGAMVVGSLRVDDDAWLSEAAQVCPSCLIEHGIAFESWDLACVTVCSRHRTALVDVCPQCSSKISWSRASLFGCPVCGVDYRAIEPIPVSSLAVTVSGDFEALARFRFSLLDGQVEIQTWDSGFRLFKCLSLSPSQWARAEFPDKCLRHLPHSTRHATTELLATSRKRNAYDLTTLLKHTLNLLAPLRVVPKPYVLEGHGLRLLLSEAGLTRSVVETLVAREPIKQPVEGHELFFGRPPAIYGVEAVAHFLGIDTSTVSALSRAGKLPLPASDEPFDIDDLMGAQRYLRDELLTLPEQHAVLGVALTPGDPLNESLLVPWNRGNQADKRIPLATIVGIHTELMARWREAPTLAHPVSLGHIAAQTSHPASTVVRAVMLILNSTIQSMDWVAPFRWADVQVEETAAREILAGAELAQS